jgi:3-methyladenine DNA glycosylase/8-oxoguanine DNA glycosylase
MTPAKRVHPVDATFSLAQTAGPVAWSRGRWANLDWIDRGLVWVGIERGALAHRRVEQAGSDLIVTGAADPALDRDWLVRVLGVDQVMPALDDPVLVALAQRTPGMRPQASGSIFDSLISCIAGQSITVAAAAVIETRISALFHEGIELHGRRFYAHPSAEELAAASPALIRQTGVTWKRAEAIVAAAKATVNGEMPPGPGPEFDLEETRRWLRSLPLVGPWTAESTLLWGLGEGDAFPPGDAALLRAVKRAYAQDDFDHRALNQLSESWRPARGWASRLLWTDLLGPAPL